MADPIEVLKYLKLSVQVEENPGEEIKEHLRNTVLGTPGKIRYKHSSFDSKLPYLGRTYFMILRRSEKLLGSVAFCVRENGPGDRNASCWYIRYFSIQAPMRASSFKRNRLKRKEKKELKTGKKPHGESLLKNFVQPYFDDPEHMLGGESADGKPSIIYAYVEKENLRSWNFTELIGFETVGKLHTCIFSRYHPKPDPHVFAIADSEKEDHLRSLGEFYANHSFYTAQNIFFNDNYLVYKKNGEILAGCQANPEVWKIVDFPEGFGRILMKYGTRLPVIRKMFVPGFQKFLGIEGIWYREGCEKHLLALLETACAMHRYHTAFIWLDGKSPVYKSLMSLGHLGIINRLIPPAVGDIRVKFNHCNDAEKKVYQRLPAYISCFDIT